MFCPRIGDADALLREHGADGDAAIFFGLSGTGKTTLSTSVPTASLSATTNMAGRPEGVYNFEGGCYAKAIKLSEEAEPDIYRAVTTWGAVLENVVLDKDLRAADYSSDALTENTRGAYPLAYIPGASVSGRASHPKHIIMLTADAFGVLPPIARLAPSQAMYHFLSGYTAKVAGTEKEGANGYIFHVFWCPVHVAASGCLREHAARSDRKARREVLARQYGMDGR